jgi:hypothetical protein
MDKQRQPDNSRAVAFIKSVIDYIEGESADAIAQTEAFLGVTLPPESRARIVDFGFQYETTEAVRELRAMNLYCPN